MGAVAQRQVGGDRAALQRAVERHAGGRQPLDQRGIVGGDRVAQRDARERAVLAQRAVGQRRFQSTVARR